MAGFNQPSPKNDTAPYDSTGKSTGRVTIGYHYRGWHEIDDVEWKSASHIAGDLGRRLSIDIFYYNYDRSMWIKL